MFLYPLYTQGATHKPGSQSVSVSLVVKNVLELFLSNRLDEQIVAKLTAYSGMKS